MEEKENLPEEAGEGEVNSNESSERINEATRRAGEFVKKNLKNSSLLKAIGPILIKIGLVLLILLIIIGIAMFIISMPGMIMDQIKEFAKEVGNSIADYFGGDSTDNVYDSQVYDVMNYLEKMNFDLKGDGFLTEYLTEADLTDEDRRKGLTIDEKQGVARYSDRTIGKAESDIITTYLMSDNYVYTIANSNLVTINSNDEYEGFFGFFRRLKDGAKGLWAKASNLLNNDGYKWGRGLIEIYDEKDNVVGAQGDYFGSDFADGVLNWDGIKVNAGDDPPTLEIRRGWFSNTMKYSLDGWTGRYGMPVDFLIAVHHATLMPDLAYDMIKTFDTKITILLHDVHGTATGAVKDSSGSYITYDQMQEVAPTMEIFGEAQRFHIFSLDSFSDKEAKQLMKLLGITSPDDCAHAHDEVLDGTNEMSSPINGIPSDGSFANAINRYGELYEYLATEIFNSEAEVEQNIGLANFSNLDESAQIEAFKGLCDDKLEADMNESGYAEYNNSTGHRFIVRNINNNFDARQGVISKKWEADNTTYTLNMQIIVIQGSIIDGSVFSPESYKSFVENEMLYRNVDEETARDTYFKMNGMGGETSTITYFTYTLGKDKLDEDGEKAKKCSDIDDEDTICAVCKNAVFKMLKQSSKVDVSNYKSYQPYISKVTNHWYRDVYFFDDVSNFVKYDYDYEAVTNERWTKYETYTNADHKPDKLGEYKLYKIDENGNYGELYDGTQEEASTNNIKVAKKAERVIDFSDIGWTNIGTEDSPRWTAYSDTEEKSIGDFEAVLDDDGNETGTYAKVSFENNVAQKGDGLRAETNPDIKRMFLKNKYFQYKGDPETAEVITKLRKAISSDSINYYGPIEGKRKNGTDSNGNNTYETVSGLSDKKVKINGEEHQVSDYISNVSLEQDFLNACTMLENIHTLDADYITRDFKELAVELGYFGKEELTDDPPRLLEWLVPETGSYGYPARIIDKNDNEYGSMIHSTGDLYLDYTRLQSIKKAISGAFSKQDGSPSSGNDTSSSTAGKFRSLGSRGSSSGDLLSLEEWWEEIDAMMEVFTSEHWSYQMDHSYSSFEKARAAGAHYTDCSLFASWALQKLGALPEDLEFSSHIATGGGLDEAEPVAQALLDAGAEVIIVNGYIGSEDQLKPGDVVFFDDKVGHVTIYYGEGPKCYDAGSAYWNSQQEPIDYGSVLTRHCTIILRFPFGNSKKEKGEEYTGYFGNEAVVSPVTGILLEYGTYNNQKNSISEEKYRTNVDYKYDTTSMLYKETNMEDERTNKEEAQRTVVDKVGYAKILVLDNETYLQLEKSFKNSISDLKDIVGKYKTYPSEFSETPDTLITKNGTYNDYLKRKDQMQPNEKKNYSGWSDRQKTIYGYKEFVENYERAGIGGYIVYIDGFICEEPGTVQSDSSSESEAPDNTKNVGKKSNYIPEGNEPIDINTFKKITNGSFNGDGNLNEDIKQPQSVYEKDNEYNMSSISATNKLNAEIMVKDKALPSFTTDYKIKIDLRKLKDTDKNPNEEIDLNPENSVNVKEYDGIFIKEGTVLGRTMTDKELLESGIRTPSDELYDDIRGTKEDKVIGNYLRIILRDRNGEIIENVEDYMKLDDGIEDEEQADHFSIFGTVLSKNEWVEKAMKYIEEKRSIYCRIL